MLTAISRLKSKNKIDKLYGVVFYFSLLLFIAIPVYIAFSYNDISIKVMTFAIVTMLFLSQVMYSFSDYKTISKIHSGTFTHFIAQINPRKSNIVQRFWNENNMELFYPVMSGILFMIAIGSIMYRQAHPFNSSFECFFPFLLILYITILIFFTDNINILDVNNQMVTPEALHIINDLLDLNDSNKGKFKNSVSWHVLNSGFVNRDNILYIYESMIEQIEKSKTMELKKKLAEDYKNFSQK